MSLRLKFDKISFRRKVKIKRYYKLNQNIRAEQVRVVDEKGAQLGVMPIGEALFRARQQGADLIEVAPDAKPPVCKIIDFKKFKYQEDKKQREGKKKGLKQETKEVRFTPFIAQNDFDIRINKAKEFLKEKNRVKLTVRFVGRQLSRQEFGHKLLEKAIDQLKDVSKKDGEPKWQGRLLTVNLKPLG